MSARGVVRQLISRSSPQLGIDAPLRGPVAPGAPHLTMFASRFYWSEVPDRWHVGDEEQAAGEAVHGPGPAWVHLALEMRIPASGIVNVSHATVSALPLKVGVSGSLVARIVEMASGALSGAEEELSFPYDPWTLLPPSLSRSMESSSGLKAALDGTDAADAVEAEALSAHGAAGNRTAGFVGASPFARHRQKRIRRADDEPSLTARAAVARTIARKNEEVLKGASGADRKAATTPSPAQGQVLARLQEASRGMLGGELPEAASSRSLAMENSIRAAVQGNMQAQMVAARARRKLAAGAAADPSVNRWRLVRGQNQCDFVVGDPVAWQRGAAHEGVTVEEALAHHVPLPSGAVFGIVLPNGLAMQVFVAPEMVARDAFTQEAEGGRKQLEVIGFQELCLDPESDYARFARMDPEAAHSLAEGLKLASAPNAGPHRVALAALVDRSRHLRLRAPPNVESLWSRLARHARSAPCPAVFEELQRSVRSFAASRLRLALERVSKGR